MGGRASKKVSHKKGNPDPLREAASEHQHCLFQYVQFCNGDRYFGPIESQNLPGGGNGLILYRDGSGFVGEVEHGKRSGKGTFIHGPTDVQYDGCWKDDYWDGLGVLYSIHDETVLIGNWKRGELQDDGRRLDINNGLTWIEMYTEGRLVSQRLVDISPGCSTSSSRTEEADLDLESSRSINSTGSPTFLKYCSRQIRPADTFPLIAKDQQQPSEDESSTVASWTEENVIEWLESFDAPSDITDAFKIHHIDGSKLLNFISKETLRHDLGIFAFGYRAKVLEQLRLLKLQICVNNESQPPPGRPMFDNSLDQVEDGMNTLSNANFRIPFSQLEFGERLGSSGPSSSIFRGRWLGKEIAIKVFTGLLVRPGLWRQYVQLMSELRHPNLVLVLGVSNREPDLHCVVIEYAAHKSLEDLLYGSDLAKIANGWAKQEVPGDSVCHNQWLQFGSTAIPSFHKHGNQNRVTVTSVEAGSTMPLNQATDGVFGNDEQTLLTRGRTNYPETTDICNHASDYLDELIALAPRLRSGKRTDPTSNGGGFEPDLGGLSNPVILSIARGITLACLYLKQKGIYHLNLKPSNVLIDEAFQAKLTDFGSFKLIDAFSNAPLRAFPSSRPVCSICKQDFDGTKHVVVATTRRRRWVHWCSPEVLRVPLRFHGFNEASDVYSFGMILWSMSTRQIPYGGFSATQIRVAVGYADFHAPLSKVCLPLRSLISSCLSFRPEERPTFSSVLYSLVNINHSSNTTAEDALIAFIEG